MLDELILIKNNSSIFVLISFSLVVFTPANLWQNEGANALHSHSFTLNGSVGQMTTRISITSPTSGVDRLADTYFEGTEVTEKEMSITTAIKLAHLKVLKSFFLNWFALKPVSPLRPSQFM